ncbi:DUF2529 domain-containing protein [Halalkalibacter urbisdiaboli]|uniref:DUF2529 domain-containing protein n=1 Tax=Halalkalibacter urbisdiaboli TaxID=1960589 RepID=UPI000B4503CB|nr:DUF2529 domain-containing protein [Halalkalibacter urbisdiaboli]
MIQIFTTQLSGVIKSIQDQQAESLEDAGRLLAQTMIADGTIYIYGEKEMAAVSAEALYGKEAFTNFKPLPADFPLDAIEPQDRVLLVTRISTDSTCLSLAKKLYEHGIAFVAISSIHSADDPLVELADVHINLDADRSLVPQDDGSRIGYPASLAALYTYFCLHLTITDILCEYD